MQHPPQIREDEKSFFEKPLALKLIWIVLLGGSALFAVLGFVLAAQHMLVHEPHFEGKTGIAGALGGFADHFPAFYAVVGFVSFSFIVLAGQHLRKILMRPEHYYDLIPEDEFRIDEVHAEHKARQESDEPKEVQP